MNKKIIVITSAIAAMAVNVFANPVVQGPVEPNTVSPTATGYNSIVAGANSSANGSNVVVFGRDNTVNADDTTVIGGGNGTVAAGETTVIGYKNYVGAHKEQVMIGANSVVDNQGAIAIGTHTMTRGMDAVTIGNNASAPVQNSVAIGTNSQTYEPVGFGQMQINGVTHVFAGESPNSSVSFGSKKSDTYSHLDNYSRQLQNVAAGRIEADSLDAINGSQLYAAINEINSNGLAITENTQNIAKNSQNIAGNTNAIAANTKAINDLSKVTDYHGKALVNHEERIQTLESTDKSLKTDVANTQNQVNINTKDIADLKGKIGTDTTAIKNELNNRLNATEQRVNRLGASSAALAGLHPLEYNKNDKGNFAISYGHYRNANAVALGAFYSPNEKVRLGFGIALGGETQFNINAAFRTGKGSEYEPQAKNGEIEQLRHEVEMLKALINK